MSKSIDSTLSSIDKQIKELKERKKRELNKMEQRVGKKFISIFELTDLPFKEIEYFIDELKKDNNNISDPKQGNE